MSISKPAPPPKKKSSCGCFGCGCAVLIALILLIIALVIGAGVLTVKKIEKISAPAPADVPTAVTTDKSFAAIQERMADFQQDVKKHEPASLHLTGDDINNLIAHAPELAKNNIRAFVTIKDDTGRLEASVPTDILPGGAIKDRYLNFNITFGVGFDQQTHMVNILPHTLQVGDEALIGGEATATNSSGASATNVMVSAMTPFLNQTFNQSLRKNSDIATFLDHAKSVEIKNSELVIESQ